MRVEQLVGPLAHAAGMGGAAATAQSAAQLAGADLATATVTDPSALPRVSSDPTDTCNERGKCDPGCGSRQLKTFLWARSYNGY